MSNRMVRSILSVTLGGLVVTSPALAGEAVRHSGSIVSEQAKHGTITIEEMGPWHGPSTRPVRREFHVTPSTIVELAAQKDEPGGFKGAFVERPIKVRDLRLGDYATVTVEREGGKAVVTKVEVVRPGAEAALST